MARDLEIDADTYTDLLFGTLRDAGWVSEETADDRAWVSEWAVEHMELAAKFRWRPHCGSPVIGSR